MASPTLRPTSTHPAAIATAAGSASLATAMRQRVRTSGLEASFRLALWGIRFLIRRVLRLPRTGEFESLVAILGQLKGAFAKAGQFASVRHDLLPQPAHDALAALRDRVPPLPYATVEATLRAELGSALDTEFAHVDPDPLGAASVAQVHRASLRDGREVAIKVQYPWIAAALPSDMAVIRLALQIGSRLAGKAVPDLRRLLDEFGHGLATELDFRREAAAARAIGENLADDPQIAVPKIIDELTTQRVLTMEYLPCVRIDDRAGLARLGVDPAKVVRVLTRAYAKQIFVDGLFHADPHPGNLFVIDEPEAAEKPRVLFVDFGLSQRLDTELRRAMREGLLALVQRDVTTFVERMDEMGMIEADARTGVADAVAAMFERLAARGGALALKSQEVGGLKDEAKRLLQETPGIQLPNDLLLYAKTLTYLFALGEALAPEEDLMKLTLPHLLRFMADR